MEKDAKKVQLGQRLRELREAKGMTRKELAESVGLSERAVIQWELGEREPGWFNITALAAALGVDCTAFSIEPRDAPPPARGRPRKADAGPVEEPPPARKGRKRKGG